MSTSLARQNTQRRAARWHTHIRQVRQRQSRAGFTLVELLVVIAILLLLLAVAIPALAPPLEDRAMREASRGVNAFFAGARDRAISSGRPYGVQLVRFNPAATQTDNTGNAATALVQDLRAANSCFTLMYVESPPPYGGDDVKSRMVVTSNAGVSTIGHVGLVDSSGNAGLPDDGFLNLIRPGDLVQFAGVGHFYMINGATNADGFVNALTGCTLTSETNPHQFATVQIGTIGAGLPYQIFRSPVRSPAATHAIPETVVLDLSTSGITGYEFASTASANLIPVTIMFAPSGGIQSVQYSSDGTTNNLVQVRPTGAIYLLLAKPQQVNSGTSFQDLKNLWVSINARTGLIQSNEMYCPTTSSVPASLVESRGYARERQGMGGR